MPPDATIAPPGLDDPFAGSIPTGGQSAAPSGPPSQLDDPYAGSIPTGWAGDETPPPTPDENLGWSDIFSQLKQGASRGFGQVGQTFGGEGSTDVPAGAAPWEWSDIAHPGRAAAKLAEKFGESAPTTATGLAGAAAGSALGPWGGIIGGGAGAAIGSALQTMGPEFQRELKSTPDDPNGAWDRALKSALTTGAFSGGAWSLFPMKFFSGPLRNAAFQIFVGQPGLAVGHQALTNVEHGQPATEGLGQAYASGAIGSAAPMVGGRIASAIGRRFGAEPAAVPGPDIVTPADIHAETNRRYGEIRDLGVTYPNHDELTQLRDGIRSDLVDKGFDPDLAPDSNVFRAVDKLTQPREGNPSVDFTDVDRSRRMLGNIWARALKTGDDPTRAAASSARTAINEWLSDPQRQVNAGVDGAVAQTLAGKVNLARQWSRADRAAQAWEATTELAKQSPNPEKYLRNAMQKIVNNRIKLGGKGGGASGDYPKEIVDSMQGLLNKGMWDKLAGSAPFRLFNPHSPFSWVMDMMAHSMHGAAGAAFPIGMQAASGVASHFANRPMREAPEDIAGRILQFPADAQRPPPPPTFSQRTGSAYSPYRFPIVPGQQQARGGKVVEALRLARRAS